jgi:hypothetical protein
MRQTKLFIRNSTYNTLILEPFNPMALERQQFTVACKGMSPLSLSGLTLVFEGDQDDCAKVRLQYPDIPDFEEDKKSLISFVWEKPIETIVAENFSSLERQETHAQKDAKIDLEKIASLVTNVLPKGSVEIKQVTNAKNEKVNLTLLDKRA